MATFLCVFSYLFSLFAGFSYPRNFDLLDGASFSADPAALRTLGDSIKPGKHDPATVFLDDLDFKFDGSGALTETRHYIFRVENDEGVRDWAEVGSQWSAWHQNSPEIRARVIALDGSVQWLDPKTLSDVPVHQDAPAIYTDQRRVAGPLPRVNAGAIVEEEIVLRDKTPLFAAGSVFDRSLGWAVPAAHTRVSISHPTSVPVRYQLLGLPDGQISRSERDGVETIRVVRDALPGYPDPPDDTPSDFVYAPQIQFSTGATWAGIAAAYSKQSEDRIRVADVRGIIPAGIEKAGSRNDEIKRIVAALHKNVRYTGVEFGESSLIPQFPSETLKRGYGDCKDKATLLVAMLRAAGIPANLALLSTGPGLDVNRDLPGIGMFDHAIVYVPRTGADAELWIDATAEFSQIGTLPWMDYGRSALIVSDNSSSLRQIPELTADQNVYRELREFTLANYGPAKIVETDQESGPAEADDREYFQGDSKESKEASLEYVKETYLADSLTALEHNDLTDITQPASVKYVATGKRGATDLRTAVAAIRAESIFRLLPKYFRTEEEKSAEGDEPLPERTADWAITPFVIEWNYKITAPEGFKAETLPPNKEEKVSFLSLTQHYSAGADGTMVQAVFRLENQQKRLTAAQGRELREAVLKAQAADAIVISFENSAHALIASGQLKQGMSLFHRIAGEHPKEAIHRLRTADALLSAGLGQAAREEAYAAVQLDPKSALAYEVLGEVQMCDLIGRRLKKGMDYEGAVQSFRKATELDPKETDAWTNLGVVLEFNRSAERYASDSRLRDAVAAFRELKKVNEKEAKSYEDNILYDLFYSKDFTGVIAAAASMTKSDVRSALIVAATAEAEGSESAIRKISEIASDDRSRVTEAANAAQLLIRIRKYPEASALLVKFSAGQPNQGELLQSAGIFAKAKPYEEAELPASDPRAVVLRFFTDLIAGKLTLSAYKSMTVRQAADLSEPLTQKQFDEMTSQIAAQSVTAGLPRLALADIVATARLRADGDDKKGYKVTLESPGAGPENFYVVRTPEGYKLAAVTPTGDSSAEDLAYIVLDCIANNDLAVGRVWLDRAREITPMNGGDDPLAAQPFPYFWTKGQDGDAAAMRRAALVLLPSVSLRDANLAEVMRMRDESKDDLERGRLSLVVISAYLAQARWKEMLPEAIRLFGAFPNSYKAAMLAGVAAGQTSDFTDVEKLINTGLARHPNDVMYQRLRAQIAELKGDVAATRKILKSIIDAGQGTEDDLNEYAWDDLLMPGAIDADSIAAAQQGTLLTKSGSFPVLHTLGCLQAAAGQAAQARETLIKAMDVVHEDQPSGEILFGFGLIAEQYGELNAASQFFSRMEKPKVTGVTATYEIAQKHLAAIRAAGGGTKESPKL